MDVNILIINLIITIVLLAIYSYMAWRWLGVGKLITEYKKAYSVMGERSGDSKRTKKLEEAVISGVMREENPLLMAAFEWISPMLEDQGIEVQPRDFMLLLKSDQIQKLLKPLLDNIELTASPSQEETGSSYNITARSRRRFA
jgi:hypothetical protein